MNENGENLPKLKVFGVAFIKRNKGNYPKQFH